MKSRPFFEVGIIVMLFGVAAWPLWHLTRPVAAMEDEPLEVPSAQNCYVRLRFSHPPSIVRIRSLAGSILFESRVARDELETEFLLDDPVMLEVDWPKEIARTAVEVRLEPEGRDTVVKTFWSEGPLREVLE